MRRSRICSAGTPVHVVQRGINRQVCFAREEDIAAYANWLREYAERYGVQVHSWVFMTNHTHLLMTADSDTGISKLMQTLGRMYVRYFNHTYNRTGALFEGRYRSSLVQEEHYFLNCQRYIELNPIRAGMVKDPGDYKWSSYRSHAFGRMAKLCSPHPLYLALGNTPTEQQKNYRAFFESELGESLISKIRLCINKGLVLGTDKFRKQVGELTS